MISCQVGLCYALSQGYLAKLFIKMSGEDPTIVLLICVAGLSVGRVLAMLTTSIVMVYLIMACVIVALGVMNTAMASACSRLADADQVNYKIQKYCRIIFTHCLYPFYSDCIHRT